jgi:ketosteroid isomerase-like protein
MMLSWLAKKLVTHQMTRLNAGDPTPTLRMDAKDVRLRFPGDSSWAGEFHGKDELKPWLQRFARVGIQISPDEVIVKGFPWSQTVCVRGRDYLKSPQGETVYENRYVIWGRMAWGLLRDYEVYEDTQKAKALDDYLAVHEQTATVS